MTNFNFRLEKVLDYKKTVEDYKKGEYGTAKKKLDDEKDKLDTFNQYKNNMKLEMSSSAVRTKVGNLAMYSSYINDITRKIEKQEQVVDKTKEELETVKEEMIAAVQEKKIFEKLKEKEYEKYLFERKKIEEIQTDTLVSYKTSTQQ
ncbi:MAG: flagellar export protein FliJ [Tissierellia bacterium]|nr:flagellar export protein FliJ [Tissierellia bacterium]